MIIRYMNASKPYMLQNIHHEKRTPNLIDVLQLDNPGNGQVNRANRKSKGYNGRTSTWHLEDGSYLRLQNVTLGYTLPQNLTRRFFVEKLRVYVSGQNLWTSTNYGGYNPEVNARPSNSLSPGEDYGTYPLAKTFLFGLNITL